MKREYTFITCNLIVLAIAVIASTAYAAQNNDGTTTIFYEDFGTAASEKDEAIEDHVWETNSADMFSWNIPSDDDNINVRTNNPSDYTGASGDGNLYFKGSASFTISGINTEGYTDIEMTLGAFGKNEADVQNMTLTISTAENETTTVNFADLNFDTTKKTWSTATISELPATTALTLTFTSNLSVEDDGGIRLDDITITGIEEENDNTDNTTTAFCVDGIYYEVTDSENLTAAVTAPTGDDNTTEMYSGEVIIPANVTYENYTYSVTTIANGAFSGAEELTNVTIGDAIENLAEGTFAGCTALTTVTIGTGTTTINDGTFSECNAITDVYELNSTPPTLSDNAFETTVYENATLHVPEGTGETYMQTDGWKLFANVDDPAQTTESDGTTIFYEDFGTAASEKDEAIEDHVWETNSADMFSWNIPSDDDNINVRTNNPSDYTGASGDGNLYFKGSASFTISGINTEGYTDIEMTLGAFGKNEADVQNMTLTISTAKNETTTVNFADLNFDTTKKTWSTATISELPATTALTLTFTSNLSVEDDGGIRLDDITITGIEEENDNTDNTTTAFCVDGIYYEVTDSENLTAAVTAPTGDDNTTEMYSGEVIIPANVTYENYTYSVTTIANGAFSGAEELTDVTIGDAIENLTEGTFAGCKALTTVTIGTGTTTINDGTFSECNAITDVYELNSTPPTLSDNAFETTVYENATLHVPEGTGETYMQTDGWKLFTNVDDPAQTTSIGSFYDTGKLKISTSNNTITIENAREEVAVYNVSGIMIGKYSGNGDVLNIDVPASGVYIVNAGGKTMTVSVR